MRTLLTCAAACLLVAPLTASPQGNYFRCEYSVKAAPNSASKVHIVSGIFNSGQPDRSYTMTDDWKAYVTAAYTLTADQKKGARASCLALSQDEAGRAKYVDDQTAAFKAQHDSVVTIAWQPGKPRPASAVPLPIGG